jgi:site-specific DNA recombinase
VVEGSDVRAALYVRVSTQEQVDRWGLTAQRRILTQLAEDRGWDPVLYDEGGASAETIGARPVLQRLLTDVAAHRIDLVAVVEMERLCRASDLRDWAQITTTFREAGVPVATPERIFDLSAAEDDFEADLHGILSKREKRKLLERTQRGLREAKDAGRFAGGSAPTGYKYDHATRKIVPDPERVPLVKHVFESDLTHWQLERELRQEGISYDTIRRIRNNPAYLGLRPNSEGKLIPADWPPIIDEELWQKQQVRRSTPRGAAFFLSGIIRCTCGKPVIGSPIRSSKAGTPLHSYKCYYAKCGQLPGWLADMLVVDALTEYAKDLSALKKQYKRAIQNRQGVEDLAKHRQDLKAKATDIEDREKRLVEAVETGTLSQQMVKKRLKDLRREKESLQTEIDALQATESIPSLPELQFILSLAKSIDDASEKDQRELLKRLATTVEIDPQERVLSVTWRFGGESRYQVPKFKGGPGRSVEQFMEIARARRSEYRT